MKKIISLILIFIIITIPANAFSLIEKRGRVAILTYHRISENPLEWNDYCISPQLFEQDLIYMRSKGYEFLKASELAQQNISGRKLAVLTFDDGYSSDLQYAVPLLEKYNACATFFVFGSAVGDKGYLSKEDIKKMSEKSCVEIGNHSFALHNSKMSTLSIMYRSGKYNQYILNDFKKNDLFLSELTGKTPTSLSYPNGVYTSYIDENLKSSGKNITFSTNKISYNGIKKSAAAGRKNRSCNADIKELLK